MSHSVTQSGTSVFVACFIGLPEHPTLSRLAHALRPVHRWRLVEDRVDLIRLVLRVRPHAVLFPSFDAAGHPHTPIIERLRLEAPDVAVAVLVRDGASGLGVTDAQRAGAEVLAWESPDELASLVHAFIGARVPLSPSPETVKALCDGLAPEHCVRLFLYCVEHAHRRLRVEDIASHLNISRRSLSRWLSCARWPAPLELIQWGRLLRASLAQWMGRTGNVSLAHASGFVSPSALLRSMDRLLGPAAVSGGGLAPLYVITMLRRRVEVVSRALGPTATRPTKERPDFGC